MTWNVQRSCGLPAGWFMERHSRMPGLEALKEVAAYAKDLGMALVVELTPADSNLIETADDALLLAEQTGMDNVKVMFDTFHVLYRNEVASDYVYRMKDKLHHVHITDSDRLPPGQGKCDYEAVLKALKDINYDGYLAMEVGFNTRQAEPDWYTQTSIAYLKEKISKIFWTV